MQLSRRRAKASPELRAAIEIQNKANAIAKVESSKPRWLMRQEARAVVAELQYDAQMTKKQRSRFERIRQANLTLKRELNAKRKRVGEILAGLPATEQKTELGIVLPSGADIGKVLTRVRE